MVLAQGFKAAGYGSGTAPLLIMGGGHDDCEDADPNTCTSSSKGRHIYVFDAQAGTRLKTFNTDRPVVGDVFVVPDTNGKVSWAYAADMGGNVYRISGIDANTAIGTTDPSAWTITKIASLGCATTSRLHEQPQIHVLAGRRQRRRFVRDPDRLGRP